MNYTAIPTVPNQQIGTIHKKIDKTGGEPFMQLSIKDLAAAAQQLSPSGFKLFLYFAENQDNYSFAYYPKNFQKEFNVSESSAKRAKAELIEKGYLIMHGDRFDFYANQEDNGVDLNTIRKVINEMMGRLDAKGISEEKKIIYRERVTALKEKYGSNNEQEYIKQLGYLIKDMEKELERLCTSINYFDI